MSITTLAGIFVVPLGIAASLAIIYIASRYYDCQPRQH